MAVKIPIYWFGLVWNRYHCRRL